MEVDKQEYFLLKMEDESEEIKKLHNVIVSVNKEIEQHNRDTQRDVRDRRGQHKETIPHLQECKERR